MTEIPNRRFMDNVIESITQVNCEKKQRGEQCGEKS